MTDGDVSEVAGTAIVGELGAAVKVSGPLFPFKEFTSEGRFSNAV
jgi:hypothetical protein